MKTVFVVFTLLSFILGQEADNAPDYNKLVEYANIVSLSYCIKHGLQLGKLNDKDTNCNMKICKKAPYKDIEVLDIFNFNDLGDIGVGYYGIDRTSKRIILAFRGTSSRRDWFANIDAMPRSYVPLINVVQGDDAIECPGCNVHRGFYNFLLKNCATILSAVKELKQEYPDYKLVVLGHSLGGAFALLSGIEFQLMGLDPLVVTYASPKIGNKQMMKFVDELFDSSSVSSMSTENHDFNTGYIRVVHKGDMVPSLPPTNIFRHGGVEYYISQEEMPHLADGLKRNGMLMGEESLDTFPNIPSKMFPNQMGKEAHSSYFVKITGCH